MSTTTLDLLRGATLRGTAPAPLSHALCTLIGRAFGTWVRQRLSKGDRRVAVGRSQDGHQLSIRDGLVQGLILSGHHVIDVGVGGADQFTFALTAVGADAGVLVTSTQGAVHMMSFFLGGEPLSADASTAVCRLADAAELSVGAGSLQVVDVRAAFAAASRGTIGSGA
jgi:phosphomannomutase